VPNRFLKDLGVCFASERKRPRGNYRFSALPVVERIDKRLDQLWATDIDVGRSNLIGATGCL
jgi:hypothetical protein